MTPPKDPGKKPPLPPAFPVIGIGASAGGLAAFEAFFKGMPTPDLLPGMAFVVVQHLAPDHKSLLTELVQRFTRMQVFEVEDGMPLQVNCVYIIPPDRDLACLGGTLQLLEPVAPRGHRLPIDYFFRSLARDQQTMAVGIVLSGTGCDGTLGVRAIKGEGGMVMAQSPDTSEFDGMPRSAISTGLVDFQLNAAEMLPQLLAYTARTKDATARIDQGTEPLDSNTLKKILLLLRAQTRHDFTGYKPGTIRRRIERRMAVYSLEDIDAYTKYLQQNTSEVEALFRDLLIGVTCFFRDADAFSALEQQVPANLFLNKHPGDSVRVWVAGCSTGEEAYSIAILIQEYMQEVKQSYNVQVFASDIDGKAIAIARAGRYPASISADVSVQRLSRFFTLEPDGQSYRINKVIRDMLVFSEQDLVKDPPFSKLDLISCRNLLIYFGVDLQKKIIPLFHYALNPEGLLFLGTSEGVSHFTDFFHVLDRKSKLYQRRTDFLTIPRPLMNPVRTDIASTDVQSRRTGKADTQAKIPLRELTERALLQQIAPAAALVDEHGDILYLHGRTGMYLEPSAGESGVNNILKMAREGLRPALGMALRKTKLNSQTVCSPNIRVKTNGHFTHVNLTISLVTSLMDASLEAPLFLVLLEEAALPAITPATTTNLLPVEGSPETLARDYEAQISGLYQELRAKDEFLQSAQEELESSSEELKSSNEEMQSVNEELQSTNEELETSKEELQSTNEELATVNAELQAKVADLSRSNSDMNNLLAGTGIGTVFVDFELRILRFTPAASAIINLIPGDVGRPVAHIVSNLVDYHSLVKDLRAVLDTLVHREVDVKTSEGKWYTLRIQPYRTLDNVIEGAVISFIEITERKRMQEALRVADDQMRLAAVFRDAHDPMVVQDLEGRTLAWNASATRVYGWSEVEALQLNFRDRVPVAERADAIRQMVAFNRTAPLASQRVQRLTKSGRAIDAFVVSTALINEVGQLYAIATTERPRGPGAD